MEKGVVQSLTTTIPLPSIFSPNWADTILMGRSPTNFSSFHSLQPNTHKISFLSTFLLLIFYSHFFTLTKQILRAYVTKYNEVNQKFNVFDFIYIYIYIYI